MAKLNLNIQGLLDKVQFGKNKKETATYLGLACLLVTVIYYFLLLSPTMNELSKNRRDIKLLRTDISQLEDALSREGALKKQQSDMEAKLKGYEKNLPLESDVPVILEEISTIARAANVKIIGISPSTPREVEINKVEMPYKELPISIYAKSGYHQIGAFINKLESVDRFIKVSDLTISGVSETKDTHDLELLVSAYILKKE